MVIEHYYIRAFWGVRKASVEECARNLNVFLHTPALSDIGYNHWYGMGNSRQQALKREISIDIHALEQFLLSGRNYTDHRHTVMKELGFLVSFWSTIETSDDDISIMLQCGCYAQPPGTNFCVINLPFEGRTAESLLRVSVLQTLIEGIVNAWNPEWVVVSSREYQKIAPKRRSNVPSIGWLFYLSRVRGNLSLSLPSTASIVTLGAQGKLIITTEERFTVTNPFHVEAANQVGNRLAEAGLLEPLT